VAGCGGRLGGPAFSGLFLWVFSRCELMIQVFVVDLFRGPVAECRVESLGIVAELDVTCHVCAGVFPGWVGGAIDLFDF
jgi:hypothetical protein